MTSDPLVERMRPFGTTIFTEMSALALRTGSINLGQGFPDTDGPPEMLEAAAKALRDGANQYPPLPGIPALRAAIAEHEQRFWSLPRDPGTEVVVTAGATEAVAAAILALCERGDEVVTFEPYYDSYAASITLAGAVRRPVTLRPGPDRRYGFDEGELRAAFGPRTRLVLLNSPHNPTGKVFTRAELDLIARLCQEFDTYAVTDEVYEHLAFTDAAEPHVPLATLPGMHERTLRISSAGKTFSCTGWKVGWATGPARLVSAVTRVKQFLTFVNAGPLQPAVAVALGLPDSYFTGFRAELQARRDHLTAGLTEAGFAVQPSEGTYFVTADITPLGGADGIEFCRELPERCGVVAVPTQVFYDHQEAGRHLIRFAFCKRESVMEEAAQRLSKLGR
ncbi:pyridoxal phosphate-dependent aminotransferase [Paractinoplanes brasiliensis]|uniref:Succinyldiaminopimelate aminotransferase n=1 Tax=Paractinoplanes brasiliensis TaxID=52695 RepID=A0A4R6JQA1_9ACTN|nr:pyridoxal phosphate-dependent aminotransferase [Actinoplanes brasiliensis]TDO38753.1 succinyldiaminopimelate aminotransferase [Actinoplanes brasiliensis]GID26469.1 aminotransferase [Actinoplanes brasiliensis]